jgi:hypothetical protein
MLAEVDHATLRGGASSECHSHPLNPREELVRANDRGGVEVAGGRLRVDGVPVHLEATEKACGVSVAKAAGEKLGTTPVDRS